MNVKVQHVKKICALQVRICTGMYVWRTDHELRKGLTLGGGGCGDQAGQQVESKTHCHFGWTSQNKNVFMYNLDDFLKEEMGKKKPTDTLAGKYTIIYEYSKPGL